MDSEDLPILLGRLEVKLDANASIEDSGSTSEGLFETQTQHVPIYLDKEVVIGRDRSRW